MRYPRRTRRSGASLANRDVARRYVPCRNTVRMSSSPPVTPATAVSAAPFSVSATDGSPRPAVWGGDGCLRARFCAGFRRGACRGDPLPRACVPAHSAGLARGLPRSA